MFWKSLMKPGVRLLNRSLKNFSPDWYYCQIWQWGNVELAARRTLIENSKKTPSIHLYRDLISESRKIILTFLNKNYGGFYLENFISKDLSIRDFKQVYLVIMTLLAIRLKKDKTEKLQEEILVIFPGENELVKKIIQEVKKAGKDEAKQAIYAWSCILDIIGKREIVADGIWRGSFVVFINDTFKLLKNRWS